MRRGAASRASAGFTLVELTVALIAGLIVALGIMTLSREATRTFHEEVRTSATEATLRTAIDRLTADLQRAGYMSTGNIAIDPMIATPLGQSNLQNIPNNLAGLRRLSAIQLQEGGSVTTNGLPLSAQQSPVLNPDLIEIGGNLTSSEQFEVQDIVPAGGCMRINISAQSPAILRIIAGNDAGAAGGDPEMRNLFQPVPADLATQFIVRLVDPTGRSQYLVTCRGATNAAGLVPTPFVLVDNATPIVTAQQTGGNGGVSGALAPGGTVAGAACAGCWVNAVQIVRWEITSAGSTDGEPAQYVNALNTPEAGSGADPNKYDLMRSFVAADGTLVPETSEIVAEYAVDLDVAFSVDAGTAIQPVLVSYPFDDTTNATVNQSSTWAPNVDLNPPLPPRGPQRIRAVRVRVATRVPQPDRSVNVPVANVGGQAFLYRYAVPTIPGWTRVRTITSEVSLPNQSANYYP